MENEKIIESSISSINDYRLDYYYNIIGIDTFEQMIPEEEPEKIIFQMNNNNIINEGKNENNEIKSNSNESNFTPENESPQIAKFNVYNSISLFQPKSLNTKKENKKKSGCQKFKIKKEITQKIRKNKSDDIRKKIKSRFLKKIKNRINELLENAGSKMFFDFLTQSFIINVTKKFNKSILNMKYKDLLLYECVENYIDYQKYEHNIEVMEYLKNNLEIMKKSNFNVFAEMTFTDMFKEYINSQEFESELENLKNEKESEEYIKNYKKFAENFIDYYSA